MIYVLERDGIAACPDDPLRVAAPEGLTRAEERELDRRAEQALEPIYNDVLAVLRRHKPTARIGTYTWDAGEIFESITQNRETEEMAAMLVGRAEYQWIRDWCFERVEELIELGQI